MNPTARWILISVITLVVILVIFYFILPMTSIPHRIGNAYFMFALVASLVLSMVIGRFLNKMFRW